MSVKCLEEGWLVKKTETEKRDPHTLTPLQQQWYEWAYSAPNIRWYTAYRQQFVTFKTGKS
ncbi:MAG: hypothetical protein PUP91_10230 [Rhizonema sp. PD37]|nr:hypothetical protein [Rhizonema sp. PD37]